MYKILLICGISIILPILSVSKEFALYYHITNVSKNDVLNVREKPTYKSKKVGELYRGSIFSIKECLRIDEKSKWCKIYPLYDGDNLTLGWVNAKYIKPFKYQEGFVIVKDSNYSCAYSLKCKNGRCLISLDYELQNDKVVDINTSWIERKKLIPATRYSASKDEEGGYCTNDRYIYEYLSNVKLEEWSRKIDSKEFMVISKFLKSLNSMNIENIADLIHPKYGIILSAYARFEKRYNLNFTKDELLNSYLNQKTLFWGFPDGKRYMNTLVGYLEDLPQDIPHIYVVSTFPYVCCFPRKDKIKIKNYEIFWGDSHSIKNSSDFSWRGLVIVLELYKNRWYISGIYVERSSEIAKT